jgi:hypothetical protein
LGSLTIIDEQPAPGKSARIEVIVEADADPLSGRAHVGFAVRERSDRGRSAMCSVRHSDAIRECVLDAHIRLETYS